MDAQAPVGSGWSAARLDLEAVRELFERQAATALGRRALRELGPRPPEGARAAFARAAELELARAAGEAPPLAGATDPRPGLEAARAFRRALERGELVELGTFLRAEERLRGWIGERARDLPACAELVRAAPDLATLRALLARTVDERGEVVDTASGLLSRLRGECAALDARIARRIEELAASSELRPLLADVPVARRGGRRVLALKTRSAGRVRGLVHDRSQSGETVFVEPRETLELGNRLTELLAEARAEEQRLLVELTRALLEGAPRLERAAAAWGELELAWIGVRFAQAFGAVLPELVDAGAPSGLLLRSVRHPLLVEQALQGRSGEVVPIDVRLGTEFDLLVITGPNTGGKTLALKTVAVAAWCARAGLPVCCATGSRVPLYDDVLADIGDGQEIRQNLSTFASHLARVRAVLAAAGPRTLVLLDELGGGTDPEEGAALSYALLEHLLARRAPTLVTTHIGKLKELAFRNRRAENASVAFDSATRRPLYTLLIGTPGESNALAIAQELGLPGELIARARQRLERREADLADLMSDVRDAREAAERLRSSAERRLEEVGAAEREARERERALAERGERLEAEAQRGIEERVAAARRTLVEARALLSQVPARASEALRARLDEAEAELSGAALSERRKAFLAGLAKGQLVYVPRFRQRCVIQRLDRARERLKVGVGKLAVELSFDEVTWYDAL
jgi:DNA mismatch repair protein MutS2